LAETVSADASPENGTTIIFEKDCNGTVIPTGAWVAGSPGPAAKQGLIPCMAE
jgi:hypothetical protein